MKVTGYNSDFGWQITGGIASSQAGGDLGGFYPGPTVTGLEGYPFNASNTVPIDGYVLTGIGGTSFGWKASSNTILAGTYELAKQGGQSVIKAHGTLGATQTFDPADGNVHTGTLSANCTFTLTAPSGSGACTLELRLTQDGTGGWTITWPGSVTVIGTLVTTAGTQSIVILETLDGGTTWTAVVVGGSVTSVGLTMPAEWTITGSPVTGSGTLAVAKANQNANLVYAGPASGAAAAPTFRALVAADIPAGSGGSGSDHEHVMDCLFSGDGSTVAWTLPASPFDQYSVAAYVAGTLTEVTLSGSDWSTATFGSAPGSGTNNIRFDIVAAVT